jgi:hypothetical protein
MMKEGTNTDGKEDMKGIKVKEKQMIFLVTLNGCFSGYNLILDFENMYQANTISGYYQNV